MNEYKLYFQGGGTLEFATSEKIEPLLISNPYSIVSPNFIKIEDANVMFIPSQVIAVEIL